MKRVIKSSGCIVLMVADYQADIIRQCAVDFDLTMDIDEPLDRKGTAVHIFRFYKN